MGRTKNKAQQQTAEAELSTEVAAANKTAKKVKSSTELSTAAEKQAKQQPAAAEPNVSAKQTKKRAKDEIDEIFGKSKKSSHEQAAADDAADEDAVELQKVAKEVEEARKQAQKPKVEGSKDDIFGEQVGKPRKRTEEGYAIYGEDELGLGKKGGGDTPLCPFDCDCCY